MRYHFLSYLRTFGVLFVVFYHSFCPYGAWNWINVPGNSVPGITEKLLEPFVAMMPLLTFLSGYLFHLLFHKYNSYVLLIKKKAQRLIIPMLVFALVYSLILSNDFTFSFNYINHLLSGYYILWYCNMLFWCFVIAYPVCKYIKKRSGQLGVLLFSFALIYLPCPPILGADMVCRMFFYFYFGYCFSDFFNNVIISEKKKKLITYISALLLVLGYIIYQINSISGYNNSAIRFLFGNTLRISLLTWSALQFQQMEEKLNYNNAIRFLDENGFGCYIFHYPLIYLLFSKQLKASAAEYYSWYPFAVFITASATAYVITYFFRRLTAGRFLLG